MSIVLILLDGVGLAPAGPTNPLADAAMPSLDRLLDGPLTIEQAVQGSALLLRPLDATFGVAGLPQSGTNHVALLTGLPAPLLVGRHQPAFPPTALRPALATRSIFRRAQSQGRRVAFANAYSPGYYQALANRRTRRSASTIAAEGAGMRLRDLGDLRAGQALYWDVDGAALARFYPDAPASIAPAAAGAVLAALATIHELVYYECFLPDLSAHGRSDVPLAAALAKVDGLIGGLLPSLGPGDTAIITSDHGNCEDTSAPGHTRNPVPLLAVGPAAQAFGRLTDIAGIADALLGVL